MRSCNTEYLLHSCDRFIVTGLWINRLQIIILTTNTLLQVWLVFLWFLVTCLFYQKLHEFNSIRQYCIIVIDFIVKFTDKYVDFLHGC